MSLEAERVGFEYRPPPRGRPVLRDVSFRLAGGKLAGVVGPNGSGKSTLMRVLLGVLRPTRGRVALAGREPSRMGARERAARIGYVPQRTSLAFAFTVEEYVRLGRFAAGRGMAEGASAASALRVLERLELADRAREPLAELSAGQQQRATLARVLMQLDGLDGRLVLADEPVSAMDPRHAIMAMDVLRGLADGGACVLVVLHDLPLVSAYADEAIMLDGEGRVAAAGAAAEVLEPRRLGEVFGVEFERVERGGKQGALLSVRLPARAGGGGR